MGLHPEIAAVLSGDSEGCIVCGDCLEVMKDMPDGCVGAVVTDPPYKISQTYSANADPDNLLAVTALLNASPAMLRCVRPGAICVVFYDTRILPFGIECMRRGGWAYQRNLTLYRRWGNAHKLAGWMSTSDFALVYASPGAKPLWQGPWRHDVYVRDKPEVVTTGHPAQKPQKFIEHIAANISGENDIILDPFCGSGTTCVAAKKLGRRWIGIEIDERYCEIARNRLKNTARPLFPEEQPKPKGQTLFEVGT